MSEVAARIAGWIRDIELDPEATRHDAILAAAQSLVGDITPSDVLDLVLLAHGEEAPNASSRVSQALRAQEDAWVVRPGDRIEYLTAATSVGLAMEGEAPSAIPFALATESAGFVGLKATVGDLPTLARDCLTRSSEELRARSPLVAVSPDIRGAFADNVGPIPEGQAANTDQLAALTKAASSASTRVANVTSKLLPALNRRLNAADEELNILWWVFGAYSDSAEKPFEDVEDEALGCVAGIEFASLLRERCPLPSTKGILSRVMGERGDFALDLTQAVPATVKLVGHEWVPDTDGHRLLPFLSSVKEYASLSGKVAWKESVSRWKIRPKQASSSLKLGEHVMHELLLVSRED
jgi:hypothetical protein